ncbi:MAG: DNA cytosine methyltransferase [Vulcanimicrobiota bacterium]
MVELVVDNFAGGGGASVGIEWALGRPVDLAINHDPVAIAMHRANHPHTHHLVQNLVKVDPREACGGRPVGLAWFSPDCFPAGTMVLTDQGYRPIEAVQVGDLVLTHRLRWRAVTDLMTSTRPLVEIVGRGHPGILVSPEHPFLVRRREDVWNNSIRRYERKLREQTWASASLLGDGFYWASPTAFPAANAPEVPIYRGRGLDIDARLMWLAGRYVADGWTRLTKSRAEVVITCGHHKTEELREKLSQWPRHGKRALHGELAWHERNTRTARQFATNHRGLVEWLREHFGHLAHRKTIPPWLLGSDVEHREAFLDGYMSGDGHRIDGTGNPVQSASTVSRSLAFSLKALVGSLGFSASVYLSTNPDTIEGREVNCKPLWSVRWREVVCPRHQEVEKEEGIDWCRIRSQRDTGSVATVYNLSVDEDESYVVEGLIVHNCKHFSKAKGGRPVEKRIRDLAWVVPHWARLVKPRVIVVENVEEFQSWGPLLEDGRPCPVSRGITFRGWVRELRQAGYKVEWRELVAADYGAPTTRKRLFVIARCDGRPIVWPEPTHGKGLTPYRTAAECIDWSIPCPSIFERTRPLAAATCRRIARGIQRYVVESANPFVIALTHHGSDRIYSPDEPFRTVTGANRGEFALVTPTLMTNTTGHQGRRVDEPMPTVTTGNHHAIVTPFFVPRYGERPGQEPRTHAADRPAPTIVPTANAGRLVAAWMIQHNGGATGREADAPLSTIVSRGIQQQLVTSHLVTLRNNCVGQDVREPLSTVTAGGGHHAEVRAFLVKYYGTGEAADLAEPLDTVTTRDRFGLVTIAGIDYVIVDIGMRMLTPRELFRAQGFPDTYQLDIEHRGKPLTKTAQIRCCGNSVCPPIAEAIVRANYQVRESVVELRPRREQIAGQGGLF